MSIIELEPPLAPPNLPPPPDSDYWAFYGDFDENGRIDTVVRGVELHPTDDLVGLVSLEDRVENAETKYAHGRALSQAEIALLALAHECVEYDYEDRTIRNQKPAWA